jgi:phenylpyruvate tautomerase PptA (4-oxalocrotonate tautomerase family)
MPLYHFEHVIQLSGAQKLALARAITDWHATTFNAPRFIVNCRFVDVSHGPLSDTYVGGNPRKINKLFISLRSGAGRTQEQLEGIADKLTDMWTTVIGNDTREKQLRGVYIMGILDSATEAGFHLPMVRYFESFRRTSVTNLSTLVQPGHFEEWVKKNTSTFQKLAEAGDPDSVQVVEEIKTRPEFQV